MRHGHRGGGEGRGVFAGKNCPPVPPPPLPPTSPPENASVRYTWVKEACAPMKQISEVEETKHRSRRLCNYLSQKPLQTVEMGGGGKESIERFMKGQDCSPSYDLGLSPPTTPLSRKQVVSLCFSVRRLSSSFHTGEGVGIGEHPIHTTARNLGPLCIIQYSMGRAVKRLPPPHHLPISKLIRGYFTSRRRNRQPPPCFFLHGCAIRLI